MLRTTVITIDTDTFIEEIGACYSEKEKNIILEESYNKSFERIFTVLDKYNIKSTIFLIASHIENSLCLNKIKKLSDNLNEIANHSYKHSRNLTQKELENDISISTDIIERLISIRPKGFRSPGATMDLRLLSVLKENKYLYDSSYNSSKIYNISKKIYSIFSANSINSNFLRSRSKPFVKDGIKEFPLTQTYLTTLPLMNFFVMPLGKYGIKLINKTLQKESFINYIIHLHEFVEPDEIKAVKIKNGFMNRISKSINERLNFLDKAMEVLKNGSDIKMMKEISN